MWIFGMDLGLLGSVALGAIALWTLALAASSRHPAFGRAFRAANALLVPLALLVILRFTVLDRQTGGPSSFAWAVPASGDFVREMFMNALLFLPLGLALPKCLVPCSNF